MATLKTKITPFLWFDKEAGEAAKHYASVFKGKITSAQKMENTPSGTVEIISIRILGQDFTLMSAGPLFKFNESISFVISCSSQKEVDHYWSKLSAHPESEQCGWVKDRFGVSWQIVPTILPKLLQKDRSGRVTQAMLRMKKLDIAALKAAAGR